MESGWGFIDQSTSQQGVGYPAPKFPAQKRAVMAAAGYGVGFQGPDMMRIE
jgi:hypothetical protein